MLKKVIKFLIKYTGKNYEIDNDIPSSLILGYIISRFFTLMKGVFKFRKVVFVGKKVTLTGVRNISLGKFVTIEDYVKIDGFSRKKMKIGNSTKVGKYSIISCTSHLSKYGEGFEIGSNSSIGEYSFVGAAGGVMVGDNVIMGQYVSFHSENHVFSDLTRPIREQGVTSEGIIIKNNVWVGAKSSFLDGSLVSENTIVAAGAVVTKKFPPNVVIGGVPAKIIKYLK